MIRCSSSRSQLRKQSAMTDAAGSGSLVAAADAGEEEMHSGEAVPDEVSGAQDVASGTISSVSEVSVSF